jgi:hypothetical protein
VTRTAATGEQIDTRSPRDTSATRAQIFVFTRRVVTAIAEARDCELNIVRGLHTIDSRGERADAI